jgi:hypothetical protein
VLLSKTTPCKVTWVERAHFKPSSQLAGQVLHDREVLIIELTKNQLRVIDSEPKIDNGRDVDSESSDACSCNRQITDSIHLFKVHVEGILNILIMHLTKVGSYQFLPSLVCFEVN